MRISGETPIKNSEILLLYIVCFKRYDSGITCMEVIALTTGIKTGGRPALIRDIRKQYILYLMFLPGFVYYIIYKYLPMAGLLIAYKDYSLALGIWDSQWVGLKYFRFIFFESVDFWNILRNTVVISVSKLVFGFPVPILLAICLFEVKNKMFKRGVQSILYLPHFVSWVIFGGIINQFLSPTSGTVNQLITLLGGEPIYFMTETAWFRKVIVATDIWKTMGWNSILYLAAITGIDPTLYEAATLDGCTKAQKTRYITLPCISETMVIMLLLNIGRLLDVGFEQIYVLYNSTVYSVGDVISTYVYRVGIGNTRFSMSTAIGMFQSVVGLVLISSSNFLSRRLFDKSIW